MTSATVLGWVMIGAAASFVGMIWPFRRGVLGIFVNLFAGVLGAVAAGLLSFLVLPWGTHGDTSARILFAALGALAALGLVHAAWTRSVAARQRA